MELVNENEKMWTLLMKCLGGECDEKEKEEVELWKNSNARNSALFEESGQILENINVAMNIEEINARQAWENVKYRIHSPEAKVKRLNILWRVAASVVLLIGIGWGFYQWKSNYSGFNILKTKTTEIQDVVLPDGTVVTVNGGSELKYPSGFNGLERKVYLSGEAFFNVSGDKAHPFIIDADGVTVRVLGTRFNVKAYKNSPDITVVVETGIVEVKAGNSSVRVEKGEKALFNKNERILKAFKNDNVNFKAWKTKQIVFVNTPMPDALKTIEDAYNVKIEVKEKTLIEDKRIDANFDKNSVDFILKVICETYHLQYVKKDGKYIIK